MSECFIGRQPIFNRNDEVYAYELLYRSSLSNDAGNIDHDVATAQLTMNAFIEIGLENVVGHRLAFINVTRQFLLTPELLSFPPEQIVLEIPAQVEMDDELVAAVRALKEQGYSISLDDYLSSSGHARLLEFAEIVKFDALDHDDEVLRAELAQLADAEVLLMAKRVETRERRDALAEMGFDYFQGYYMAKPTVVSARRLPTNKLAILQLLAKLSDPKTELADLERLVSQDASLSLRVLRFVNSPLSGLAREVESIHQAVVYLGRDLIKNWVMLLTIANLDDTIPELVTTAFVRARLCESLAKAASLEGKESFFTVGLFSLVDAMMGVETEELLATLPFTEDMKQALLEHTGARGEALVCVQELEVGAPQGTGFRDVPGERISEMYREALHWADETVAAIQ